MRDINDAILLAVDSHKNQKRKDGTPYIFHPLRVMHNTQGNIEYKIAAILHDVVEDSDVTIEDLKGFPEKSVEAVNLLTIYWIEGLTQEEIDKNYFEYIEKIKQNPIAREIKIRDLQDNMSPNCLLVNRDEDIGRLRKYKKALDYLLSEE